MTAGDGTGSITKEAEALRDLLVVYWQDQEEFPERVPYALWLCEHTSRQAFLDSHGHRSLWVLKHWCMPVGATRGGSSQPGSEHLRRKLGSVA